MLDAFYDNPILNSKQLKQITCLTMPTIDCALRGMIEKNILKEITGYNRNRIYLLHRYFDIFANEEIENSDNL